MNKNVVTKTWSQKRGHINVFTTKCEATKVGSQKRKIKKKKRDVTKNVVSKRGHTNVVTKKRDHKNVVKKRGSQKMWSQKRGHTKYEITKKDIILNMIK